MISHLRRLTLVALVSLIPITVYPQSAAKRLSETDKSRSESSRKTEVYKDKVSDNRSETRDGEYWFGRGYSLHQSDRYVEAIDAFSHSIALGHRQATSMYNVACGYALLNDKENALFWLDRSISAGFDRPDLLRNDSDLDPLRADPRFSEIAKRVSASKKEDKPGKDKTISRLEDAINNFDRLTTESSQDGDEWYKIGSRLLRLRDFDRAAASLTRAIEYLPYNNGSAMYNLACTYSLKGDRGLGLEWLEKSINAGFDNSDKLKDDPDIASLRGEPRFKDIVELSRLLSLSQFNSGFESSQYSKPRWAPAIKTYERFVRDNPNNGRAWFNLGYALHFSSEHSRAVQAFERSSQLGFRKPTCLYNIACGYSMMGNRDSAFEWLEKSVDAGFNLEGYILADEDLNNLRSDPRFKRYSRMADEGNKHKQKTDK